MERELLTDCVGLGGTESEAGNASGGVGFRVCARAGGRERCSSCAIVERIEVAPRGGEAEDVVERESLL